MAFHIAFVSARTTPADPTSLLANVRTALADSTVGVFLSSEGRYLADKDSPWSANDVATCQAAIDACVAETPQSDVKAFLDNMPLVEKAIDLTILDQINLIRSKLPTPLVAITPAQWVNAVKAKVDAL